MTDTSPHLREDLSVDQQLAQFATASSVPNHLPLAAERFARQRLQALARVEGTTATAAPSPCSCVRTTPAARRWRWGSSPTSPATTRSAGPGRDRTPVRRLLDELHVPVSR